MFAITKITVINAGAGPANAPGHPDARLDSVELATVPHADYAVDSPCAARLLVVAAYRIFFTSF